MVICVIGYLAAWFGILLVDIFTKAYARVFLLEVGTIPLWKDVFHFTYVENYGAAFGIFQNGRIFFIILTVVVLFLGAFAVWKHGSESRLFNLAVVFASAGAVGNLIDRIFRGFVVDFLDFRLIDFPVFNVADIFICIGAVMLAVYIIFFEGRGK